MRFDRLSPHVLRCRLSRDTRLLTADGRIRLLSDVRTGDEVCGTTMATRRRYATTVIESVTATAREAYGVRLADGTALVVGADQGFLTYRGWKYVTGKQQGAQRRPHLTTGAKLLGTGTPGPQSDANAEYRRGYLCGLIRGDGHVGSYVCRPAGKAAWVKHGFRLALADLEALDRARIYLLEMGISVNSFVFQPAMPTRRPIHAIGCQSRAGVDAVRRVICWPEEASDDWRRGFLGGIFDAEGSCAAGAIRIANTDTAILEWVEKCLRHFEFTCVPERQHRRNGLTYIRIRGGLRERLRFFQLADSAISRKRRFIGLTLRSDADLRVVSIEPLDRPVPLTQVVTSSGDLIADGVVVSAARDCVD